MFQLFKDHDRYLYHYTSAETSTKYILPRGTIKLSRYVNTNDPKESKDWTFSVGTNEGLDLGQYDLDRLSRRATKGLKHRTNLVCFSQDRRLTGDHMQDIHQRGFCKPRMWAQYGDQHRGVCLIFDRAALGQAIEKHYRKRFRIFHGRVVYRNRGIVEKLHESPYGLNIDVMEEVGMSKYLQLHIETHYQRLFFEKAEDWQNEDEYRWVLFGTAESDLYLPYERSLAGIVFGTDCEEADIRKITSLCHGAVQFEQLVWRNCSPWLSFRLNWP